MLRCAPLVSPPFVSPRRNSRAPSLFRRCAPYKSSHPDQSVADLTRPRRFLMKSSLTRSVAPLICQTGIMQTRLRAILFGAFALAFALNFVSFDPFKQIGMAHLARGDAEPDGSDFIVGGFEAYPVDFEKSEHNIDAYPFVAVNECMV